MKEVWKEIPMYEGYYEVSNLGNVRSMNRYITQKTGKIYFYSSIVKKLYLNKVGYLN